MLPRKTQASRTLWLAGTAAVALLAMPFATALIDGAIDPAGAEALADSHGGGQDGQGGRGEGGQGGQGGGGGGGGHDSSDSHDDESHDDSDHGGGARGGQGGPPDGAGNRPVTAGEADEDSDRPDWAGREGDRDQTPGRGNESPGTAKGDLYGDLYVVLRDAEGAPITDDSGYVQPIAFFADGTMVIDENGNPILLELNEEGEVVGGQTYDDQPIGPGEVEFGRSNVGRAPDAVLEHSFDEAMSKIAEADQITYDAAGRLVLIDLDDDGNVIGTATIDSPLENLALYIATLTNPDMPFEMDNATSFLAAATDKTGLLTIDEVAYLNSNILGLDVELDGFTYDRAATYDEVRVTWLERQDDGSYVETEAPLSEIGDKVFTFDPSATYLDPNDPIVAFTQAVDDARAVILFEHDMLWDIY